MTERERYAGWTILEDWRVVVGFEGLYEVSQLGRVRRIGPAARAGKGRGGGARLGRILKPQRQAGGYLSVALWREGKPKRLLVHVLVARAFLGEPPDGHEANHRSGDKSDCRLVNLEYLTRSDNQRHAYRLGLRRPTTRYKVTPEIVEGIRVRRAANRSLREIGRNLGLSHSTVAKIIREEALA